MSPTMMTITSEDAGRETEKCRRPRSVRRALFEELGDRTFELRQALVDLDHLV
jgi:hypothetical protein